jgi:hypothetical protein
MTNTITINYQAFKDSWAIIDTFVKQASVFPRATDVFEKRYGVFNDKASLSSFVKSLSIMDGIFEKAGSPGHLKQLLINDPQYLTRPQPPAGDLYGKTVWLSNQAANIATVIATTIESWKNIPDAGSGNAAERARQLTDTITGASGIAPLIEAFSKQAGLVADFSAPLIQPLQQAFLTISDTGLLDEANETIGRLESENGQYAARIARLKDSAKKLFGGRKIRQEIEELTQKIAANEEELAKKKLFTSELNTPFFVTGNKLTGALEDIKGNLERIARDFSVYASRLAGICKISSTGQLSDRDWVDKAFDTHGTIAAWQQLRDASTNYAVRAFSK